MHMVINIAYFIIVNIKSVFKISDTHLMPLMNFLMHLLRHILFWNLRCMKGDCNRKVLWPDVNFFEKMYLYFMFMNIFAYMSVCVTHVYLVPTAARRGYQIPLGL